MDNVCVHVCVILPLLLCGCGSHHTVYVYITHCCQKRKNNAQKKKEKNIEGKFKQWLYGDVIITFCPFRLVRQFAFEHIYVPIEYEMARRRPTNSSTSQFCLFVFNNGLTLVATIRVYICISAGLKIKVAAPYS